MKWLLLRFLNRRIDNNGFPHKLVMDKSCANYAGLENINRLLMLAGLISCIESEIIRKLKVKNI